MSPNGQVDQVVETPRPTLRAAAPFVTLALLGLASVFLPPYNNRLTVESLPMVLTFALALVLLLVGRTQREAHLDRPSTGHVVLRRHRAFPGLDQRERIGAWTHGCSATSVVGAHGHLQGAPPRIGSDCRGVCRAGAADRRAGVRHFRHTQGRRVGSLRPTGLAHSPETGAQTRHRIGQGATGPR